MEWASSTMPLKLYSPAEVGQHNMASDCWMIIDGFVYDVTGFLKDHPGGSKILVEYAGADATDAFHEVYGHDSDETVEMMSYLLVGKVGTPPPSAPAPASPSSTRSTSAAAATSPSVSNISLSAAISTTCCDATATSIAPTASVGAPADMDATVAPSESVFAVPAPLALNRTLTRPSATPATHATPSTSLSTSSTLSAPSNATASSPTSAPAPSASAPASAATTASTTLPAAPAAAPITASTQQIVKARKTTSKSALTIPGRPSPASAQSHSQSPPHPLSFHTPSRVSPVSATATATATATASLSPPSQGPLSSPYGSQMASIRARNAELRQSGYGYDSLRVASPSGVSSVARPQFVGGRPAVSSTLQIPGKTSPRNIEDLGLPVYSLREVAHHCLEHDCWLAIDGVVYDVSAFMKQHPGGSRSIMRFVGRECSEDFHRITGHQFQQTTLLLEQLRVGTVQGYDHAAARHRREEQAAAGRERVQRTARGGNGPVSFKIDFANRRVVLPGDDTRPDDDNSNRVAAECAADAKGTGAGAGSDASAAAVAAIPELDIPVALTIVAPQDTLHRGTDATPTAPTAPSAPAAAAPSSSPASLLCYPAHVQGTPTHAIVTLFVVDPALALPRLCPSAGAKGMTEGAPGTRNTTDSADNDGNSGGELRSRGADEAAGSCYCGRGAALLGWRHLACSPQALRLPPASASAPSPSSSAPAATCAPAPLCASCPRALDPWPFSPLAPHVRMAVGQHVSLTAWRDPRGASASPNAFYGVVDDSLPASTNVSMRTAKSSSPAGLAVATSTSCSTSSSASASTAALARPCFPFASRSYTPLHTCLVARDPVTGAVTNAAALSRYTPLSSSSIPAYVTMVVDLLVKPCGANSRWVVDCALCYRQHFFAQHARGAQTCYFDILASPPPDSAHTTASPFLPPLFLLSAPRGAFSCPSLLSGYFLGAMAVVSGTGIAAPWPVLRRFLGVYSRPRHVHVIWAVADLESAGFKIISENSTQTPNDSVSSGVVGVPHMRVRGVASPLWRELMSHLLCHCRPCQAYRTQTHSQVTPQAAPASLFEAARAPDCAASSFAQLKLTLVLPSLDALACASPAHSNSISNAIGDTCSGAVGSSSDASPLSPSAAAAPFCSVLPSVRIVCGRLNAATLPQLLPVDALATASARTLRQQQLNNSAVAFDTDRARVQRVGSASNEALYVFSSITREAREAAPARWDQPVWMSIAAPLPGGTPRTAAFKLAEAGALVATTTITALAPSGDPVAIATNMKTKVPEKICISNIPVYSLDFPILTPPITHEPVSTAIASPLGAAANTITLQAELLQPSFTAVLSSSFSPVTASTPAAPVPVAARFADEDAMSDDVNTGENDWSRIGVGGCALSATASVRTSLSRLPTGDASEEHTPHVLALTCGSGSFNNMAESVLQMQRYAAKGPRAMFVFQ